jgi:hypothetical protein
MSLAAPGSFGLTINSPAGTTGEAVPTYGRQVRVTVPVGHAHGYGGAPGASGYQATVTLTSGSQTLTATVPVSHDAWALAPGTRIALQFAEWQVIRLAGWTAGFGRCG